MTKDRKFVQHKITGVKGRVRREFETPMGKFIEVHATNGDDYTWDVTNVLVLPKRGEPVPYEVSR